MPLSDRPRHSRKAALLLGAAALAVPITRAGAQSPSVLHVGGATADTSAQAYFAEAGGFFKAAGLNVEITQLASTGALVSAVVGGALDVGTGSPLSVVTAREQGIPLSIIAPGAVSVVSAPTTLLMVAPNSPLKTAADLEGKVVSTPSLRGLTEISVVAWCNQSRADASKIKYAEMPFSVMPTALEAGRIDAAMLAEPTLTLARPTTREPANPYPAIAESGTSARGSCATTGWPNR